jgi:serine protease
MASKFLKALVLVVGVVAVATAFGGSAAMGGGKKPGFIAARATHSQPITQLIVKYRDGSSAVVSAASAQAHVAVLGKRAGVALNYKRAMSGGAHVLSLSRAMTMAEARDVAKRISADPAVLYAEPDAIRRVTLVPFVPNDPGYSGFNFTDGSSEAQWHLFDPTQDYIYKVAGGTAHSPVKPIGGANLPGAWNVSMGAGIVVGVVDTGVVDHADLSANLVGGSAALSGYDFISSGSNPSSVAASQTPNWTANDGDGRDPDPTDPGDWVLAGECGATGTADGAVANSSWHGTHVSGTIAAVTNNGLGVAGVAPLAKVRIGRALGRCGGLTSDIVDAIRWVAGLPADRTGASWASMGIPTNTSPAKVINLSLSGGITGDPLTDACSITEQNTVNALRAAHVLLVAAAGNDMSPQIGSPANCPGVIAVTAHTLEGDNADYANVGSGQRIDPSVPATPTAVTGNSVTISAPGGGCGTLIAAPVCANQYVWSTVNKSTTNLTAVDAGDGYGGYTGTSMAAPHVSGVVALLLSIQPSLSPDTVTRLLTASARHFVSGYCADPQAVLDTGISQPCGAGMLDASAAVSLLQASVPTAVASTTPANLAAAGSTVNLTCLATAVTGGSSVFTYQWTQTAGTTATITNATSANASFTAPTPGGNLNFKCAAQDADGFTASGTVSLRSNTPPTIPAIADKAGTAGTAISFTITGTDAEHDPLTYVATGLPTGATLSASGVFSWPSAGAVGTYPFTVHANDGVADSAETPVHVVVSAAPPPSSGGGGGAVGLLGLLLLLGAARGLVSNRTERA